MDYSMTLQKIEFGGFQMKIDIRKEEFHTYKSSHMNLESLLYKNLEYPTFYFNGIEIWNTGIYLLLEQKFSCTIRQSGSAFSSLFRKLNLVGLGWILFHKVHPLMFDVLSSMWVLKGRSHTKLQVHPRPPSEPPKFWPRSTRG